MTLYVPPGTSNADAAAMIAAVPMPTVRRRAARRVRRVLRSPSQRPVPRAMLVDGKPVMEVPLSGESGAGKVMVLDLLDWDRVCLFLGAEWTLKDVGHALYVVSRRKQALRHAGQRDGSAGSLRLARWLAGAGEGQVVTYANGDTMDLRRCNLRLEGRGEHWERHRVIPVDMSGP